MYIELFVVFFVVIFSILACVCFKKCSDHKKLTNLNPVVIVTEDISKSKDDNDSFPKGEETDQLEIGEKERTSLKTLIDNANIVKQNKKSDSVVIKNEAIYRDI